MYKTNLNIVIQNLCTYNSFLVLYLQTDICAHSASTIAMFVEMPSVDIRVVSAVGEQMVYVDELHPNEVRLLIACSA